ncbi:hypothetical protein [Pseudomonas citronellolis]|uniref:hypothetical protein n=1 Tax=Pseudomonas citronellolis TaxID=53408 RepID=UPI0023E38EE8|nr:hypothetical protein [Pseudomonas citronellolis]MDF3932388.1 hypothetical protein [Pseudomonas citronellolis]
MAGHKLKTVGSFENLKSRIERLFEIRPRRSKLSAQLSLELNSTTPQRKGGSHKSPTDLLNHISETLPNSEIYLFGGVIRDLALFGRNGFNSDIDIVVDGDWPSCKEYLNSIGAKLNKFGGFRLEVSGWPIDIWSAQETWAIRKGLIEFTGISSLTKTTILNWDAVLMNWDTRKIICAPNYLDSLKERQMDIVLRENPNPLGATTRVFRHLCAKDARSITQSTAEFLANSTTFYSLKQIKQYELSSYGSTIIESAIFSLFKRIKELEHLEIRERFEIASRTLEQDGATLSFRQLILNFNED